MEANRGVGSAPKLLDISIRKYYWPSMKIDIVPLVVMVFCVGVAVSALFSTGNPDQIETPLAVAQVQK
jgi:hypothetical protein